MRRNEPKKMNKKSERSGCEVFVGFGWSEFGRGWRVEVMEVKGEGCGMGAGGVENVAEVHEEGVAAPLEAILNERIGELGPVEEVGGCDPDGVSQPSGDVGVFGWELVCLLGSKSEEGGCFGSGDVLEKG